MSQVMQKSLERITSDAIILDKCVSWFNLTKVIMEEKMRDYPFIDFGVKAGK